ncbi:hypothetical protein GCM10011415_06360 [Salipiger pallidus]|uniref:Uncharacterized protein n=1 Tax=Salipiger pallidus TaxID=1775170 RepID=A0A8J2ZHA9_9RHOB|nr:hypothetical protein [Salipiger pallidus]GGG62738.1 hypothetical protein GCM10011415_06360 [Salipiger pallidus]
MSSGITWRQIALQIEGEEQPFWVIQDTAVTLPGDNVSLENANGSIRLFTAKSCTWATAKQGQHSFGQVQLTFEERKSADGWVRPIWFACTGDDGYLGGGSLFLK